MRTSLARDQGFDLAAKPIARAAYDRVRTLDRLGQFIGHRDAERVAKADAVRWKESMQARALAVSTIRNVVETRPGPCSALL
jgi:hypothetical protein